MHEDGHSDIERHRQNNDRTKDPLPLNPATAEE